jgi:tetratricopeptide (TPR) repeat protein
VTHFILLALQSKAACRFGQPIWRGKPPVAYLRWLTVDADGFTYGIRHIQWTAVDEMFLTLFGNLEIRSDAFSGPVFKIPFGYGSQADQKIFVEQARAANPSMRSNRRLDSRIASPIVKGQNVIQLLGAGFMALVLIDVAFSLFAYLEMLKHYYLAQAQPSRAELQQADYMHAHPFALSWVTNGFLNSKGSAADIYQARANANIALGDLDAAVADSDTAIKLKPDGFRLYLLKARILAKQGKSDQAAAAIKLAIEHHQNSILPKLYLIANDDDKKAAYDAVMKELNQSTFEGEPRWPGVNNSLNESYYSDDIHFIFDKLVKQQ